MLLQLGTAGNFHPFKAITDLASPAKEEKWEKLEL
jgi:hypothetical protein